MRKFSILTIIAFSFLRNDSFGQYQLPPNPGTTVSPSVIRYYSEKDARYKAQQNAAAENRRAESAKAAERFYEETRKKEARLEEERKAVLRKEEMQKAYEISIRTRTIQGKTYTLDEPFVKFDQDGKEIIRINGKYGLLMNGNLVQPLAYDRIHSVQNGLALVQKDGKYGYLHPVGTLLAIPLKFDKAESFMKEGMAKVKLNEKFGFIDKSGNEMIPVKWDSIGEFNRGLAKTKMNRKYGYIDLTGKEVVKPVYDSIGDLHRGNSKTKLDGKYGYLDWEGKEIAAPLYDDIYYFRDYFVVKSNAKYRLQSRTEKAMPPLEFDDIEIDANGLPFPVKQNNQWGLLGRDGSLALPARYDSIGRLLRNYSSFWKIKQKNQFGFVNQTTGYASSIKYDSLDFVIAGPYYDANNSWIKAVEKGRTTFLNLKTMDETPDDIRNLSGFGRITRNGKMGVLDKKGNVVLECRYDSVGVLVVNSTKVYKDGPSFLFSPIGVNGKWGMEIRWVTSGKIITRSIPTEYDEVRAGENVFVRKGSKWGYWQRYGILGAAPEFDKMWEDAKGNVYGSIGKRDYQFVYNKKTYKFDRKRM